MEDWKHCPQFAPLADLIRSHGSFAVIAHVHPDGDAIGSTLALGEALKQMGKKVVMMNEDGVPSNLAFMPGVENIIPTPDEPVDVEVAISVDNGALKRLGERSLEALAGVKVWANIDHHRTNELFGDVQCVLPDECATGAVLYYFFKYLGVPVTPVMRDALYVAVSTDTGSFQYQMTTAAVMELAADLIRMGVDVQDINRQLYQEKPWVKMQLMREALNGMKLTPDGRICTFCLTNEAKARIGSRPEDTEGLIDLLRSVQGVWLAAYLEETEDDPRIRISLRSKTPEISVAELASRFGGGGHSMAAGVRIRGPIEEVRLTILKAMREEVESRAPTEDFMNVSDSIQVPSGVLLIDKARDMTSHDVVAIARRSLGIEENRPLRHAGSHGYGIADAGGREGDQASGQVDVRTQGIRRNPYAGRGDFLSGCHGRNSGGVFRRRSDGTGRA